MVRPLFLAAFCLAPFAAQAEIRYTVQPIADNSRLQVTMRFSARPGPVEVQMPNWAPGAYVLSVPGRRVEGLQWKDAAGNSVTVEHPSDNAWKGTLARGGETTITYTVPTRFEAGALHYSGPSTYLYVVGRKEEDCRLKLDIPANWKVAVGLNAVGNSTVEYKAPDYDVLADNPVTAGDFIEYRYTSHGKPITIALRGDLRKNVNEEKIVRVCKVVADSAGDFFGGLPFDKYVWHFAVTPGADGGGGLEHLSSTQISLAQGVGPTTARVCAHEFFHLWNVKRIRSKPLGPFDYTQLPKTGALYWLEGVTDYYSSLLMTRSGYRDEASLHQDLVNNLAQVRSNPARWEVSPYESSYRVGEANEGRGNSSGWRISYYNLGWLVGLCLDLELRHRTSGRNSLDDVERALWALCKDGRKPGFSEDEIERQYVRFGGSHEFFEKVVKKPGELPVESTLSRIGLRLEKVETKRVDRGFDLGPSATVNNVRIFAASGGLANGDVLLEVNGQAIGIGGANAAFRTMKIGDSLKLKVRRGTEEKEITYWVGAISVPTYQVVESPNATPRQKELRQQWYRGK